jgi:Asp-tRNA(Asn)/Glu-tRNA(Gln) amidotransferase A subunit family amidase
MGPRQLDQAALFYEFSLERHVPATHLLRSINRFVDVNSVIAAAMVALKNAGAELVEVDAPALDTGRLIADNDVQKYEFKALLNAYLAAISDAPAKSLAEIIASGKFHKPSLEKFLSSAESFANDMEEPDYKERLLRNQRTRQLLRSAFAEHKLDALVYPLQKRLTVPLTEFNQADRNGILASVTGFPAITVPAGLSSQRCGTLASAATSSRPCTGHWSAKGWRRTAIPRAMSCTARTRPSASLAGCSTRGLAATRWASVSGW